MATVAIISGKGGCGKTQTCQNLIGMHSIFNGKIGVVDADPTRQLTGWMLDTFSDLEPILEEGQGEESQTQPTHYKSDTVELFTMSNVNDIRKTITSLEEQYGFVVVDTPGFNADVQQIVASVSDLVIYPANSTKNDYNSCIAAEELIQRVRGVVSHTILSCIYLNKINEQGNSLKVVRDWFDNEGIHVLETQLPYYEAFKLCSFNGGIPTKGKPGEKIEELYKEVWSLLDSINTGEG